MARKRAEFNPPVRERRGQAFGFGWIVRAVISIESAWTVSRNLVTPKAVNPGRVPGPIGVGVRCALAARGFLISTDMDPGTSPG